MASKEVSLHLAAFLYGPQVRALGESSRQHARQLAELLLSIAYEDLGKKPRLLDGEDVRAMFRVFLPGRLAPRDPRAAALPAVFEAFLEHLEANEVVPQAYEVRRAYEDEREALLARVASGANADGQLATRADPFVHRAARTGRNDPCSCGSGKKFKKCHGKEG